MEIGAANLTTEFPEVTPEQIASGTVLNEGELQTPDETVPPPPDGGGGPGWSLPEITLPTMPGRPRPTTAPTTTTTTTEPDDTTTTSDPTGPPGTANPP